MQSQQPRAVVFAGLADSPAFEQAIRKIGDFPTLERSECDHCDLCSRLLSQLSESSFDGVCVRSNDTRGIVDQSSEREPFQKRIRLERRGRRNQEQAEDDWDRDSAHDSLL
jgi:hypothetical protein